MATWFKDFKLQDLAQDIAQAAQQHVSDLQHKGSQLTDLLVTSVKANTASNKDCEFADGALGFKLEGSLVVEVEAGGQAELLGVEVGDRLVEIAGYEVPSCEPGDVARVDAANRKIMKWLKEMPRPSRLTFSPPPGGAGIGTLPGAEDAGELPMPCTAAGDDVVAPPPDSHGLEAAPALPRPTPLQQQPGTNIGEQAMRQASEQMRASLDSERRKAAKLLEELGLARAKNKELLAAASRREANGDTALEAADARERALVEEVSRWREAAAGSASNAAEAGRLRSELSEAIGRAAATEARGAALQASLDALHRELQDTAARADALQERASIAERRGEVLARELQGFHEAHDAEVELLREEHGRHNHLLGERLQEQERESERCLAAATKELLEAQRVAAAQQAVAEAAVAEAQAAAVEAGAARAAERAARAEVEALAAAACQADAGGAQEAPEDAAALYQRIEVLEKRCVGLQRKLNAQMLCTTGQAGGGQTHPIWLPWVVNALGPRAGALSVLVFSVPDRALRNFTQRLLKHTLGLWIFYVHLLLLYTMAASCGLFSSTDASSPLEPLLVLNKQISQGNHR